MSGDRHGRPPIARLNWLRDFESCGYQPHIFSEFASNGRAPWEGDRVGRRALEPST